MIDREAMIQEVIRERNLSRTEAERVVDFMIAEMSDLKGVEIVGPWDTFKRIGLPHTEEPKQ